MYLMDGRNTCEGTLGLSDLSNVYNEISDDFL